MDDKWFCPMCKHKVDENHYRVFGPPEIWHGRPGHWSIEDDVQCIDMCKNCTYECIHGDEE